MYIGARSSAGEHYVDIVGVAGSIPAAPTIFTREEQCLNSTVFPGSAFQIAVTALCGYNLAPLGDDDGGNCSTQGEVSGEG